jgi:hypothetical protein
MKKSLDCINRLAMPLLTILLLTAGIQSSAAVLYRDLAANDKNSIVRKCMSSIKTGDINSLDAYADKIITWSPVYADVVKLGGAQCLTAAKGEDYVYDELTDRFVSKEDVKKFVTTKDLGSLEFAVQEALEESAEADKIYEENNSAIIVNYVHQECLKLYGDIENKVLLNPICLKSFKDYGHPETDSLKKIKQEAFEKWYGLFRELRELKK